MTTELTHSQYGALVDAWIQARVDVEAQASGDDGSSVRGEAETELEDAATATYEQIAEDPRESTGWNSEMWSNLVWSLQEDVSQQVADAVARRCGELANIPYPAEEPS